MKNLRVGCGAFGTIFAGKLLRDGRTWGAGKQDVTIDALVAVAQHVIKFGKPVEISGSGGGAVEYRITVEHVEVTTYEHLKIDDPIIVTGVDGETHRRHFAGVDSDGKPQAYSNGNTSFTATSKHSWDKCEKAHIETYG